MAKKDQARSVAANRPAGEVGQVAAAPAPRFWKITVRRTIPGLLPLVPGRTYRVTSEKLAALGDAVDTKTPDDRS